MLLILINCVQEELHARSKKKWNVLRFPLKVLWAISLSGRDSEQRVGCSQPGTRPAKATQQRSGLAGLCLFLYCEKCCKHLRKLVVDGDLNEPHPTHKTRMRKITACAYFFHTGVKQKSKSHYPTICWQLLCHLPGQLKVKVWPPGRIVEISSGRHHFGDGRLYLCPLSPLIEGSYGHQSTSAALSSSPQPLLVVGSVSPVPSCESVPWTHLKIVVARPEIKFFSAAKSDTVPQLV